MASSATEHEHEHEHFSGSSTYTENRNVPAPLPVSPAVATLLNFLSPEAIQEAISAADWSVQREVSMMASIANDKDQSAKNRMIAAKAIRQIIIDSLRLSGRLVSIHAQRQLEGEDGAKLFQSLELKQIVQRVTSSESLLQDAQRLLPGGPSSPLVADLESVPPENPETDLSNEGPIEGENPNAVQPEIPSPAADRAGPPRTPPAATAAPAAGGPDPDGGGGGGDNGGEPESSPTNGFRRPQCPGPGLAG